MKIFSLIGLLFIAAQACAQLSMPNVFGDHMVLQSGKPVKLWGKAAPMDTVTAEFAGHSITTKADRDGKWSLHLPSMKVQAKGKSLSVSDGSQDLEFENVVVGEVWFASGQSNMEWRLNAVELGKETAAKADEPGIRFFQAKNTPEPTPQFDVEGQWQVSTPETAGNFSAVAYFFALKLHHEINAPIGIIQSDWGGKPVETFTSAEALRSIPEGSGLIERHEAAMASFDPEAARQKYEADLENYKAALAEWNATPKEEREGRAPRKPRMAKSPGHQAGRPTTLWNGMIHPLVGYTIRGAIWYQGESNARSVEQASDYGALFSLKIEDWREQWGDDFRYLWVQLANFRKPVQEPGTNAPWAIVQEHQRRTLDLPKTGMAIINDIGEAKDIHPRNKKDVGERLARWALADEYGKDVVRSGPIYKDHKISGDQIAVIFDYVGDGLKSRDGEALQRFEIQDKDGQWHWAEAIIKGDGVILSHPDVKAPTAARYAWAENPEGANLVNSEGLPASLFTTEW